MDKITYKHSDFNNLPKWLKKHFYNEFRIVFNKIHTIVLNTKKIIVVALLLSNISISAQTNNNDSLNLVSNLELSIIDSTDLGVIFYNDWSKKYNSQMISVGFGVCSVLSTSIGLGISNEKTNTSIKNFFILMGGTFALSSLIVSIINIEKTKKIRNNYKKLKITPSGIQVNF